MKMLTEAQVFVPSAMSCARCGDEGVAYPVEMPVGVAFACPTCTPPWLDNFMLWKLDEKRVGAGLDPLSPDDLPAELVFGEGPCPAQRPQLRWVPKVTADGFVLEAVQG